MNVLFVIPTLGHGGAQKVIVELCNHTANLDQFVAARKELATVNNIALLTFASDDAIPFFYSPLLDVAVLTTDSYPAGRPNLIQFLLLPLKLRRIIRKRKVDVAVSFQDIANFPTLLATIFSKTNTIVSERQDTQFYNFPRIRQTLRFLIYPLADKIVVQTDLVRNQMPRTLRSRVQVIGNACPTLESSAQPNKPIEGRYRAIVVGRLEHQKNLEFLIESCKTITQECQNWTVEIVGAGSLREKLQSAINHANLTDKVFLRGAVNDIGEVLSNGNLFLFPSLYEGFPNALAEAISAGLPAIAFRDVSGAPELITHNLNGLLLERESATELHFARAAIDLMNDHSKRKLMGMESVKIAETYRPSTIFRKWSELINTVAQGNSPK